MEENEKAEKSSMSSDERIESLQNHLDHREKKLKELSIFLGDMNNDLNNVLGLIFLNGFLSNRLLKNIKIYFMKKLPFYINWKGRYFT